MEFLHFNPYHYDVYCPNHLVFKSKEDRGSLVERAGAGSVYDRYGPKEQEGSPEWVKAREDLRRRVPEYREPETPTHNLPRPVTPRARRNFEKRLVDEIFSTKEIKEYYKKTVQEAIERLRQNPGSFYEYIREHTLYDKGDYKLWNKELAAALGINPDDIEDKYKTDNEELNYMRIAAGMQIYMFDYFRSESKSGMNRDVFQTTFSKGKVNPFIYVDGKTGMFTLCVMGEFWNRDFDPKLTDAQREQLGKKYGGYDKFKTRHAKLTEEYESKGKNKKLYEDAMGYLEGQLYGKAKKRKRPEGPEQPEEPVSDEYPRWADNEDRAAIKKYRKMDKGGASVAFEDTEDNKGELAPYKFRKNHKYLSSALGEFFGETDLKDGSTAPKTFRIIRLLAETEGVGAGVDSMPIYKDYGMQILGNTFHIYYEMDARGNAEIMHAIPLQGQTPSKSEVEVEEKEVELTPKQVNEYFGFYLRFFRPTNKLGPSELKEEFTKILKKMLKAGDFDPSKEEEWKKIADKARLSATEFEVMGIPYKVELGPVTIE